MNFTESFNNSKKCKAVAEAIYAIKGVPLFYCKDEEESMEIAQTLYHAGFKVIEFTNRGENALSVFQKSAAGLKVSSATFISEQEQLLMNMTQNLSLMPEPIFSWDRIFAKKQLL